MIHIKTFENYNNPQFKKGDKIFFRLKVDEFNDGNYNDVTIKDNVVDVKDGKIFLEDGYIFDEETLYLLDNEYYDKFPYEKPKLFHLTSAI